MGVCLCPSLSLGLHCSYGDAHAYIYIYDNVTCFCVFPQVYRSM